MLAEAARTLVEGLFPSRCFCCGRLQPEPWCAQCRRDLAVMPPPVCEVCGAATGSTLCRWCLRRPPGFDRAYSAFVYQGSLRRILLAMKFGGYRNLAEPLGEILLPVMDAAAAQGGQVVVPIPTEPLRRWRRGFSPPEWIARGPAAALRLPVETDCLRRRWGGRPQVGLDRMARSRNVRGRFYLKDAAAIQGRNVILVDDILTTGATCSEAALLLKSAGACEVLAITVARDAESVK